jgi:DNA polymerase-3 subunit delta
MDVGKPVSMLLKEYRIWGPRERLMEGALRRLKSSTLQAALREAAQIDKMVKGLRAKMFAGDAWDSLLQLGLKVAR